MRALLPTLTISTLTLLMAAPSAWALRRFNLYLPAQKFCAVYQGAIESEKQFTLWVDDDRDLTIKIDRELKVAVTVGSNIVPAYQIEPVSDVSHPGFSEHSYRTSMTGSHVIFVKGIARDATITFCLH